MTAFLNDKPAAVKTKRPAVRASAILAAPVEKGQIITPPVAILPSVAVKTASPTKAKTAAPAKKAVAAVKKSAVPAKKAAAPVKKVTGQVKTKTKPAPVAAALKSKPAVRTAKHVVGEKVAAPEKAAKTKDAKKKNKVVRDSFTMPEGDYAKLAALKARCLTAGVHVKKSELLRAGLQVLETLPAKKLLAIIAGVENVKTGRPANI